jgi:adenine-specific DNA-methyltransferase
MLVDHVDLVRIDAGRRLDADRQAELGQFMTPAPTARLMASMFEARGERIRLLDAGAAVGSLTAAWVAEICDRKRKPKSVQLTAYELDEELADRLKGTLKSCQQTCDAAGVCCEAQLRRDDFLEAGVRMLDGGFFSPELERFDAAILNPPYRKFTTDSQERLFLRQIGVKTSNLYTAFLSVVLKLLAPGGEIVAITPRSFCNGPYFKPFRKLLIDTVRLRRVHVFESRTNAFREDEVLQENIIFHAVKEGASDRPVEISSSTGPDDDQVSFREVPYEQVVRPHDPDSFIHLVGDEVQEQIAIRMCGLEARLGDVNLTVSTGRVVDFRAPEFIRQNPGPNTVPLIYPTHFDRGFVRWPKESKKPNAMEILPGIEELLVPSEPYVLVKRFSAKEERRRVVAAVYDPGRLTADQVGFENHLNYFHRDGHGLSEVLAKGLAVFLNSTLVDLYFRQFNGHTQVNATDLRNLRYPSEQQLMRLGARMNDELPGQDQIDDLVEEELFSEQSGDDPVKTTKKVQDALIVLRALGFPRQQINERSALTLLALLDLKPKTPWAKARDPLIGITPMMDFFGDHYGKRYKPNTRETVRRQTVHQFLDAGLVVINPDEPSRPTNSPNSVYQIEAGALALLRSYGARGWDKGIKTYLTSVQTLKQKYAREREMKRIPLKLAEGKKITLSPGGQNVLIEHIVTDFCERFTPGGHVVYVGDTDEKFAYFDKRFLKELGVEIEAHGKMPDVVVYHKRKKWLVLIEAVTSYGPVDGKRRGELKRLFKGTKPGLVFVTAFLDRKAMVKYLGDISWETEVWIADAPDHLIHFNGERFLGPYDE